MSYFPWQRPYVSVAKRRREAERTLTKLKKTGQSVAPVKIEGRLIANSFWGKSWCENLERYSDYASRLPRGRSYVRNGSVLDLQVTKGEIVALVSGSSLYTIKIAISPVRAAQWKAICHDCAGSVDSLVELLQGRLAKNVMDRVCRKGDGLFPSPAEIKLSCSCPDSADMCKHVAAALYGVGARLDSKPQLLFVLRGVDETELLARAGQDLALPRRRSTSAKVLDSEDVAALFGLDMADTPVVATSAPGAAASRKRSEASAVNKPASTGRAPAVKAKRPPGAAANKSRVPRAAAAAVQTRARRRSRNAAAE